MLELPKNIGIKYECINEPLLIISELDECANLYSQHYGKWSQNTKQAGKQIKLSCSKLNEWFLNYENTHLYTARNENKELIGYAIALRAILKNHGVVSWVTQLVVHENYRNQGIASNLLRHIWGFSNDYAWGIVTSNPFAIRALEKATRRICNPREIKKIVKGSNESRIEKLIEFGSEDINYINKDIEIKIDYKTSQINTEFPVDHSGILSKIEALEKESSIKWIMGDLEENWEWFAFTFRDQKPFELGKSEILEILDNTDKAVKMAYRRMLGGVNSGASDIGKPYTKYTSYEIDYIVREGNLTHNMKVLDFGCGNGRHSNELARRGYCNVIGVDFIQENIDQAQKQILNFQKATPKFEVQDCREYVSTELFDVVLCLYDVIGSFTKAEDNLKILQNISQNLSTGGVAFISVMNSVITEEKVEKFCFKQNPNKIFELESSTSMEKTGEVFDPKYMLLDENTGIYYRKEQFMQGAELPIELLVCDRRYTKDEIIRMCKQVGLDVVVAKYVHAGDWCTDLEANDKHAKEILIKAIKI